MKKQIISLMLSIASITSYAQSDWNLSRITNSDNNPVGFILHSHSVGTKYTNPVTKSITSLRFVCSLGTTYDSAILIFWEDQNQDQPIKTDVVIKIDGKIHNKSYPWVQEGKIIYVPIKDSATLISDLTKGKLVQFEWNNANQVKQRTVFSITDLNKKIKDFNKVCQNKT